VPEKFPVSSLTRKAHAPVSLGKTINAEQVGTHPATPGNWERAYTVGRGAGVGHKCR